MISSLRPRPVLFLLSLLAGGLASGAEAPLLRALLVGGGPDPQSNAAQIEGHARYAASLLPPGTQRVVLFADGKPQNRTVSYLENNPEGTAQRAMSVLLPGDELPTPLRYRTPELGVRTDGPSSREAIHRAFNTMVPRGGKTRSAPLLLYFAGHGSTNGDRDEETEYDLWGRGTLPVRDLATEVARLPKDLPVVLVMVQCYSGAFAQLLFRNGSARGELVPQNLVGFFSARKDREAAGCGWDTGEADYQDFSSYFFGALSGVDRFGHAVPRADFDGDGRVSLHEAFCQALAQDKSSDTPVCTSDAFLRRYAFLLEVKACETPYTEAWQAASPAQRAALDRLSQALGLEGEGRALAAYDRLQFRDPLGLPAQLTDSRQKADALNALRLSTLQGLFSTWPALRERRLEGYRKALQGATKEMEANAAGSLALVQAAKAQEQADGTIDNDEAMLRRLVDLYSSVVMTQQLRAHGPEAVKRNFERLWTAEQRTLPLAAPR